MVGIIDSEWGIIAIVAAVVFLFGSTKLPQFARSLGLARSEFHKGASAGKGAKAEAEGADATADTAASGTAASDSKE